MRAYDRLPIAVASCVAALLFIGAPASFAAPNAPLKAQWAVCGPGGSGQAVFSALATDKTGNIYASGVVIGEVALRADLSVKGSPEGSPLLAKFGSSGQIIWARTVGGSGPAAFFSIAADSAGSLYAAGFIGPGKYSLGSDVQVTGAHDAKGFDGANMILAKYDPSGKPLWARALPKDHGRSYLNSVAVDTAGSVYAAGYVDMEAPGRLALSDMAPSFTAFPGVMGNNYYGILLMYDAAGRAQWSAAAQGFRLGFKHVSVDEGGEVTVGGEAWGRNIDLGSGVTLRTASDLTLVGYGPSGKARWARSVLGSTGEAMLQRTCSDGAGSVYAAFTFRYSEGLDHYIDFGGGVSVRGSPGSADTALVKYGPTGRAQWAVMVADRPLRVHALAAEGSTVYVSGEIAAGPLEECLDFGDGVRGRAQATWGGISLLAAYDTAGKARWAMTPLAQGEGKATLIALLPDGRGGLLCAGELKGEEALDFGGATARAASSSGCPLLVSYAAVEAFAQTEAGRSEGGPCPPPTPRVKAESPFDPTVGIPEKVEVIRGSSGSPLTALWAKCVEKGGERFTFAAAAADAKGDIVAVGNILEGRAYDFGDGGGIGAQPFTSALAVKYSASGKTLWARTVKTATAVSLFSTLALDASGNAYVMGYAEKGQVAFARDAALDIGGAGQTIIVKYDAAGNPLWARGFEAGGSGRAACAVGLEDAIYATASGRLVKLDSNGNIIWTAQGSSRIGPCLYGGVATDGAGNVVAMGSAPIRVPLTFGAGVSVTLPGYAGATVLVKYDVTGTAQWASGFAAEHAGMELLGLDAKGNVYAAGFMQGMHPYDFGNGVAVGGRTDTNARQVLVVVKYNSGGVAQWERNLESASGLFKFRAAVMDDRRLYIAGTVFRREGDIGYEKGSALVEFLAAYDLSGGLEWVLMPPWDSGKTEIQSLIAAPRGLLMITRLGPFGGMNLGSGVEAYGMDEQALVRYELGPR